jgi:hypothetical protein
MSYNKEMEKQAGQTSVEYILMLVVVVSISMGVYKKIEEGLITNPNSFVNSYIQSFSSSMPISNGAYQGQYKRFTLRR